MNNLYEYIDPIASPYEAFLFDSTRDSLPIPAHWHYYVELLYVLKGEIEVSLDNVTSIGTEGSVILFPPKCVHSIALAKGSVPVQYDVIKFDPNLLPTCKTDELDLRSILHGLHTFRCPCIFSPEQVRKMDLFPLFSDILKEYRDKELGYSMILTADLRKIISRFVRNWQKSGTSFPSPGVHPSYEISFDLISEYIDSHYFEELTVEKLAAMCNMSHSTFSMNFYRRYNMTCKEYITATRINAAENMLLFSSHDVSFIAREVGYPDCSYFIRCYKKINNVILQKRARIHFACPFSMPYRSAVSYTLRTRYAPDTPVPLAVKSAVGRIRKVFVPASISTKLSSRRSTPFSVSTLTDFAKFSAVTVTVSPSTDTESFGSAKW